MWYNFIMWQCQYNNLRLIRMAKLSPEQKKLLEAMNLSATEYPSSVNEFEISGVTPAPSKIVRPPRVSESPVSIECKLSDIVEIGDRGIGSGSIIIGEILHVSIADEVLLPKHKINTTALDPVSRLSGPNYGIIGEIIELQRFPSKVRPK